MPQVPMPRREARALVALVALTTRPPRLHTQQRRDPSGSRLFRRIPGKYYGAGGAHKPRHSDDSSSSAPTQPHAGPLIRTRVRLPSPPAQSLPEQQGEPLRISSVTYNPQHVARGTAHARADPPIRTPALQSARGPANPHVGPPIRMPALQSARRPSNPHAGPPIRTRTLQSACRPSNPHADPLIRAWADPPTLQIAGLRAT